MFPGARSREAGYFRPSRITPYRFFAGADLLAESGIVRWIVWLLLIVCLAAGGYFVYREPRVQELFRPIPAPGEGPRRTVPAKLSPEIETEPDTSARPAGESGGPEGEASPETVPKAPAEQEPAPASPDQSPWNSMTPDHVSQPGPPNRETARVLLGILKAQGLAYGISLTVSDEVLGVQGEVSSEEDKTRIIEILEKGRGHRRLETSQLKIQ